SRDWSSDVCSSDLSFVSLRVSTSSLSFLVLVSHNVLTLTNLHLAGCHVNHLLCQKHHQWPRSVCDDALMLCYMMESRPHRITLHVGLFYLFHFLYYQK